MILEPLFAKLVNVFSGPQAIETHVRDALCNAQFGANLPTDVAPLPKPFLDAMSQANAQPYLFEKPKNVPYSFRLYLFN